MISKFNAIALSIAMTVVCFNSAFSQNTKEKNENKTHQEYLQIV